MISNKKIKYRLYNSYLKEYLFNKFNYDNSHLIYSSKYNNGSFSINIPNLEYKNCDFINNYPHFHVPIEVCLEEINNFINGKSIYNDSYTIRYGDLHPNKPFPMLGQLRNIYLNESIKNCILTEGNKKSIFTIGDISFKTIQNYVDNNFEHQEREIIFQKLVRSLMSGEDNGLVHNYKIYCQNVNILIKNYFEFLDIRNINMLNESDLYYNQQLSSYLKTIAKEDELKQDGNLKYVLQEFMFILNNKYKNTKIINIIGCDQAAHIKKVNEIIDRENIDCNLSYLTYGICKNACERELLVYKNNIENQILNNNINVNGISLNFQDYLRLLFLSNSNNNIIDFNNIKSIKNSLKIFDEIFYSLDKSKNKRKSNVSIEMNDLLNNMTLINQVIDSVVVSGETRKLITYLNSLAKLYLNEPELNESMSNLYYQFVLRCLELVSLNNTQIVKNIIEGDNNDNTKIYKRTK